MDVAQQQQQRSQNVQRKAPLHEMTLRGVSISEILYPVLPAELDMLASRGGSAVFCVDRYDKIVISGDVPRCLDHGHAYDIACQKVPIWLRDINHPRKHPSRKKHKSSSPDADVPSADVDTQPQQPVIELGEHANKPRWSIQHMKKRGTLPSTPLLVARLAQRHPEEVCMSLSNVLGSGTLESFRRMDVHVACRPQVCMMPSSAAYEQRQTSAVLPHATMYNTAFSWWAYIRVAARELKNAAPSADAPYATSSSDQCSTKPLTWFTDLLEHAECYVRDMTIKLLNNVYEEECLGVIPTNVLVRVAIELCSPKAWSMCFWWNTAQFSFMLPELSPAEARRISWIAINRDKDEPASDSARPPVGILTPGTTWRAAAIVADEHSFIRELTDAGVAFVSEQMLLEHPRDDPVWQITRADLDAAETLGFVIASQEKLRTINALNYRTESDLSKADVRIVALLPTLHMEAYVAAKLHDIVHERDDTAARLALQQHAARQRPPAVAGTINPTEEQTAAILACLNSRLHVVVGGPGTGKTSVVAKGVANAFPQDCVVFVAATGTAAERLCQCVGMGYTVHSVVAQLEAPRTSGDDAERCTGIDPTKVCVLLVEEASAMPAKMLIALLDKMPAASRVYMFGDDAQMPPPCGGPSVFSAIIALNTHVSRLCQCMRVSHKSDALLHNLTVMRHHVLRGTTGSNSGAPAESASIPMSPAAQLQTIASKCYLNWSSDLQQPHSFYFVAGGSTPAATTGIVRRAMTSIISSTLAENVLADKHPSFQVVTHTNRMVELMLESWAAASLESSANAPPVRINGGSSGILLGVGDRLMFKKNRYGARIITNGMIVTIERIVDGLFDPRLSWHAKVTLGKGSGFTSQFE